MTSTLLFSRPDMNSASATVVVVLPTPPSVYRGKDIWHWNFLFAQPGADVRTSKDGA